MLKWARENGCPWNEEICNCAAFNGNLEMLKWARQNSCPWNLWLYSLAASRGHIDIVKWAKKNNLGWNKEIKEMILKDIKHTPYSRKIMSLDYRRLFF